MSEGEKYSADKEVVAIEVMEAPLSQGELGTELEVLQEKQQREDVVVNKGIQQAEEKIDELGERQEVLEQLRALHKHPLFEEVLGGEGGLPVFSSKPEALLRSLDQIADLTAADPEFALLYRKIMFAGNRQALTRENAKASKATYKSLLPSNYQALLNPLELLRKRKKLAEMREFTHSLTPVRADSQEFDEYQSPRKATISSRVGARDALVAAGEYVYASVKEFPHTMAGSTGEQRELDPQDIKGRAEFVMQDIADLFPALDTEESDIAENLRQYLINMFDDEGGEELLATYFASVFASPEEARKYLATNSNRVNAQNWKRDNGLTLSYPAQPTAEEIRQVENGEKNWFDIQPKVEERASRRREAIYQAMLSINEATGIVPPFQIEVRIRDSAKVKK